MDDYVLRGTNGQALIPNPSDPLENFADKWVAHPQREQAFYRWLEAARRDFLTLAVKTNRQTMFEIAAGSVGGDLARRARDRSQGLGRPGLLTGGLVRDEAEARRQAVRLQGDNRSA